MQAQDIYQHLRHAIMYSLLPLPVLAMDEPQFSGLIEIEGDYALTTYTEETQSQLSLATVELGLDQRFNHLIDAHLKMLYEEGDTPFGIDEGTISIMPWANAPMSLTVGKMVLPFGQFESELISDPTTLELAEINRNAMSLQFQTGKFSSQLFAFIDNEDDSTKTSKATQLFGASLSYTAKETEFGISYLHNLAATDIVKDAVNIDNYVVTTIPALSASASYHINNITLQGEMISALKTFSPTSFDDADSEFLPMSYHIEMSYTLGNIQFITGYHGSSDADALGLAKHRLLVGSQLALKESMHLALQIANERDYADTSQGSYSIAGQLRIAF